MVAIGPNLREKLGNSRLSAVPSDHRQDVTQNVGLGDGTINV